MATAESTEHWAERLLEVDSLSVRTAGEQGRTLVRGVSFSLGAGETLAVVGESGSGKSMTARSLIGLLPAGVRAEGSARYAGRQLIGVPDRAIRGLRGRKISLLMQDPFTMLNPLQTAREHIVETLQHLRRRERDAEARRRLTEVGLEFDRIAGRYPFQLSGGMLQRVALAAALTRDPELLIADEPTTALDVTTQAEILRLLKQLQRNRGMAVLLITHDLRVAFSVADRVAVMYAGSMLEEAPARDLVADPAHPYSLGLLLAEPPVTHYAARLDSIPGNVPQADEVADRCPFAARCPWMDERCLASFTPLASIDDSRATACLRIGEIRPELRGRLVEAEARSAVPEVDSGEALLIVRELEKSFSNRSLLGSSQQAAALRGVSFQLSTGESVGLVGETGSGKSTIARCILGLTSPDHGAVNLRGLDISDYRRLSRSDYLQTRRTVQAVFQDPFSSLNPSLRIGSALAEALRVGGRPDDEQSVGNLLGLVGLPAAYARRRPAALSGGERQRVAVARALGVGPSLLVCDEPVASLDVSVQAQILELLRTVRRERGIGLLFITHDLSVVRQMTDRLIVLYNGEVVESGRTAQVLDAPTHPYTVRLLKSMPSREANVPPS